MGARVLRFSPQPPGTGDWNLANSAVTTSFQGG
jgi:hypothetical protein